VENVVSIRENIQQLCKNTGGGNFGDVMVVGGGISGIQASLDLAAAGFKVYLVEKCRTKWSFAVEAVNEYGILC